MLPRNQKLASPDDFSDTIKRGTRGGSRTVIAHVVKRKTEPTRRHLAQVPGPRFGLIVSKAVGNSVVRHQTSRYLRHSAAAWVRSHPEAGNINVVLRALPAAGRADSAQLNQDMAKALRTALKRMKDLAAGEYVNE